MRIAVLGGAGFIGSNFVHYLVSQGDDVLVYDKLTYAGRIDNLRPVLDRITFVKGDIANEEFLNYIITEFKPDVIVNFAAETHVDRSINDPAPFIRTNIVGTFTVLEIIKRTGIDYVHISTDEVYGDLYGATEPADEESSLKPSSPYSASKASGDLLIMAYGRTYGINYKIVRPCNNYGPYQHPEKLIPRTIIRLLHEKPATIYGDGSQVRDWLYVKDFAEALYTIIRKAEENEVYNVCAEQPATVREIVTSLVKALGKDSEKYIRYVRGRPGEDRLYSMKCDRIKELGWFPRTNLNDGLKKTIDWYLENKWWWEPIIHDLYILEDEPWRR